MRAARVQGGALAGLRPSIPHLRWAPVAVVGLLALVGLASGSEAVFEPAGVLPVLNLAFLTALPLAAAVLAIPAYRSTGVLAVLALGTAMVATSVGAGVLPASLLQAMGPDAPLTVHNTSMLIAAAFHLGATVATIRTISLGANRGRHVVLAYGAAVAAVLAVLGAYLAGVTPAFWSDGSTTIRQAVLLLAIGLLATSAFSWWQTSVRDPEIGFLRWYVPGLALAALGLVILLVQPSIGGLVNWSGRASQYLAAIYFLTAVATQVLPTGRGATSEASLGVSLLQAGLPFRPLVESTSDAVIAVGPDGRVIYWNRSSERLFGYSPREAFDRQLVDLLTAPLAQEPGAVVRRALDAPDPSATRRLQLVLGSRDGHLFHAELSRFATADERLVVFVVADDSARVDALATLEARVHERTADLEELTDHLQRANRAKDEFLGLVSHELKTPITTILAAASVLQRRAGLDDDGLLTDLAAEANRLASIVDNLLALARLDAGAGPDREPILLDHVIRSAVAVVRRDHPDGPYVIDTSGMAVVEGNREQMAMVVRNLVHNARKYSPPGAAIRIETDVRDGQVEVRVIDEGYGIEESDPAILFEPFYRAPSRSDQSGVGIGLAVCERIITAMGGTIGARSRSDKPGSVFWFSLPVADDDESDEPLEGAPTLG